MCLAGGFADLQDSQAIGNQILSWKEDLLNGSEAIKNSGSIAKLQGVILQEPTALDFGVAMYVCLAAEIVLRDATSVKATTTIQDIKQLNNTFLNTKLKITKANIPRAVINAVDKVAKDGRLPNCLYYFYLTLVW